MAKKRYYHVLVFTNTGPAYVTNIPERNWAEWDRTGKPKVFNDFDYANQVAFGLSCNFNFSCVVATERPFETQPYAYDRGEFKFEVKKDDQKKQ